MTTENYNLVRHDWNSDEVLALFDMPFNDLLFKSATIHRQNFDPNKIQTSTLLSIKTGSCPEDCKYCPQSAHYNTELEKEALLDIESVKQSAQEAKDAGATRFCMGAAWRSLNDRDMPQVSQMIKEVKDMGLETCVTLGMAKEEQLKELKEAGLDYYNHNLDTSEEFYGDIITTRTYKDRLETLENVRNADLKTCCGGIVGMGEEVKDRANLLINLANLPDHPESVPINMLVKVKGTPLENVADTNHLDFVRTIAVARILMPKSYVRLSAGREIMSDELQALCFFAGANSIFYGEKLLTTANNDKNSDAKLLDNLGIEVISSISKENLNNSKVA